MPRLDRLEDRIALSSSMNIAATTQQLVVKVGTVKVVVAPVHLTVSTFKTPVHYTVTSPTSIKSVQTTTINNGSHSFSSTQTFQSTTSKGSVSFSQVNVESGLWD